MFRNNGSNMWRKWKRICQSFFELTEDRWKFSRHFLQKNSGKLLEVQSNIISLTSQNQWNYTPLFRTCYTIQSLILNSTFVFLAPLPNLMVPLYFKFLSVIYKFDKNSMLLDFMEFFMVDEKCVWFVCVFVRWCHNWRNVDGLVYF